MTEETFKKGDCKNKKDIKIAKEKKSINYEIKKKDMYKRRRQN